MTGFRQALGIASRSRDELIREWTDGEDNTADDNQNFKDI
jgi:hypothetical protein